MNENKRKLLAKVAYLYYIEDNTQAEIAKTLNIYRTTISRMLKQARAMGIVKVQIEGFDTKVFDLEQQLKRRFGLDNAVVVPNYENENHETKEKRLSAEAALYLKQIIKPKDIVGFAWGSVLAGMVGQLNNPIKTEATFVPLVGGPSTANMQYHVNGIVYDAARQFGGRSLFVDAAAVQESKYVRDGIMNAQYFQEIQHCWANLDIAFVGIGGGLNSHTSRWRDLLTATDQQLLKARQAVGDCCCTFYDRSGKILTGDLLNRTIAIELAALKQTPNVVGVARSLSKVPSIKALLTMSVLNTLITDEVTAQRILDIS
ncbi:sugar-binding transcriptional regulator [Agrilactobacillus yilanensis]|uniref:Sugar-binding transcriptional regulator n=1 Tax=Agrilactobacillus yilanensis TaxID=2485997 RepID=A0ABW4J6K5_9LACO|nr:sugar-binding transcriptional regulator [Agrilactobacillus yilanensis]